jgi:hypothetical protein
MQALTFNLERDLKCTRAVNFSAAIKVLKLKPTENLSLTLPAELNLSILRANLLSNSYFITLTVFYLIFIGATKFPFLPPHKNLILLGKILNPNSYYNKLQKQWTLRRLLNKRQTLSVITSSTSPSQTLFEMWKIAQAGSHLRETKSNLFLLYHMRRILDKVETLSSSNDKQELLSYHSSINKLLLSKGADYRRASLKSILRQAKHRRRSRWALFPRAYLKRKTYTSRFRSKRSLTPRLPLRTNFRNKPLNRKKYAN